MALPNEANLSGCQFVVWIIHSVYRKTQRGVRYGQRLAILQSSLI